MKILDTLVTAFHARSTEAVDRAMNYTLGGTGIGVSLVQATTFLQFVAAGAGAILVCRQLYRDIKKNKK